MMRDTKKSDTESLLDVPGSLYKVSFHNAIMYV